MPALNLSSISAFARSTALVSLIFLISIKGTATFDNTIDLTPIPYPEGIGYLRESATLLSGFPLLIVIILTQSWNAAPYIQRILLPYFASLLIFVFRVNQEIDLVRALQATTFLIALASVSSAYARAYTTGDLPSRWSTRRELHRAIFLAMTVLVTTNTLIYFAGYGYVEGLSRFFGLTSHPNFIGASCAIAVGMFVAFALDEDELRKVVLLHCWIMAMLAALLVLASGSRTALVTMILGVLASFYKRTRSHTQLRSIEMALPIICIAAGYYIIYNLSGSTDNLTPALNRLQYEENTRTDAWALMWANFVQNPWLGAGSSVADSENSWLKIAAVSGILGLLPFILFSVYLLAFVARSLSNRGCSSAICAVVCAQMLVAAVGEGGLVEAAGVQTVLLALLFAVEPNLNIKKP